MADSGTMPEPDDKAPADILLLALPVSQKVVLVIDLVESVRLMAADEAGTVARWHEFAQAAEHHTIPQHKGRLVKSLGDGLMVEFDSSRDAANAAYSLHGLMGKGNQAQPPERHMHLRAGINATHVYTDHNDIYGAGVNLAARIATLAGPGETVVTAPVRDGLTDGLDATVQDLGECYLKHIDEPVRAYRVGQAGPQPVVLAKQDYSAALQPTVAVIPFSSRSNEVDHFAIGEMIADGVIGQLAKTSELRVISRLSTSAFRNRNAPARDVQAILGANYILTGAYFPHGDRFLVTVELVEADSDQVVWAERLESSVGDLLAPQCELISQIANMAHHALLAKEVQRTQQQPLATLKSHSLLLGAVNLLHRTSKGDFFRARDVLLHLQERHSRHAVVPAWLAKWHVLQVEQGWSDDTKATASLALDNSRRALDINPDSPLALCMDGFVRCNLLKDFDLALKHYELALRINPNESLAWLLKGMLHAFRGESAPAVEAAGQANLRSPLDPARYFYDSLSASIHLSAGNYGAAIQHAKQSLRINSMHVSTFRALTIAQVMDGQVESARQTAQQLLKLDPLLTVSRYLARSPGIQFGIGKTFAEALGVAGVPH